MERAGRRSKDADSDHDVVALAEEVERLRGALETASRQAEEYQHLLRQTRVDFAEFRRELERQRSDIVAQARVELILKVVAILEEHQRPESSQAGDEPRAEALEHALRQLLEAEGVEKIDALGAIFNPWEHQALHHQTSPELDDQRVLAVLRDGYRLGDRVIRPAQVVVARRGR